MKRNDGGYVLAYVVVVIVILCILVPAACANSLQNLKAQQASVERMRQLYEAEGKIEQFVAETQKTAVMSEKVERPGTIGEAKTAVKEKFKSAYTNARIPIHFFQVETREAEWEWNAENSKLFCKMLIISKTGNVSVSAQITVKLSTTVHAWEETENEVKVPYYSYQITDCTVDYDSYEISTTAEGVDDLT